ncbi:hypothetical protein Aperf_G00000113850 [Anoplocephala perfoliata]
MELGDESFRPLAISTPDSSFRGPGPDLNESHMSGRSLRKRLRRPQRREETGTEVLVAIPRNPLDSEAINMSNVNNANDNSAPASRQRKRMGNVARLVAAEIRYLQRTTHPLLRRASFARVVRSIAQGGNVGTALRLRWQPAALDCLQEAAEAYLVDLFTFAARAAAHANRVTVMIKDLNFIMDLYGKSL